jgi:hypothetical protein
MRLFGLPIGATTSFLLCSLLGSGKVLWLDLEGFRQSNPGVSPESDTRVSFVSGDGAPGDTAEDRELFLRETPTFPETL